MPTKLININGNRRPPTVAAPALPADELVRIAVSTTSLAAAADLPPGPGRRWVKLVEAPTHEAWLIAWPAGSGLPMHHHQGAAGALHVVRGRLHERHLVRGVAITRLLGAGEVVAMPPDHVHQITNADATDALSVHVYSPPGGGPEFV